MSVNNTLEKFKSESINKSFKDFTPEEELTARQILAVGIQAMESFLSVGNKWLDVLEEALK